VSMESSKNPYNPLLSQFQKMEMSETSAAGWEQKRVERLLKVVGLSGRKDLKQTLSDPVSGYLSFDQVNRHMEFRAAFAAIPLRGKTPMHRDQKSIQPNWFKSFVKVPVFNTYMDMYLEYLAGTQDSRPYCAVFPRKGFLHGLCVHNGDLSQSLQPGKTGHVYCSKSGFNLIVQPFDDFLLLDFWR
jgi:hypothetical protein